MITEITSSELALLPSDSYMVIDIRNKEDFELGHIENAVNVSPENLTEENLPSEKILVICCKTGLISEDAAEMLRENGYDARNLVGGYARYLIDSLKNRDAKTSEIERSIHKKFHRSIFSFFVKAINTYQLVNPGDKIAVCISGGKDSMLMAKLFQLFKRISDIPFELTFLVMNPGYSEENFAIIKENARILDIPITVFETNIFDAVDNTEKNPCHLCAKMRRGHLYSKAKSLGCNKIALGHHFDDIIETTLMSMIYGGQVETMLPKLHSDHFEGMEIIRPMYLIREEAVKGWAKYNGLSFIQCACHFTETCSSCNPDGEIRSKRQEIKQLIASLAKKNPQIEMNIFRSVENVNLKKIISYKADGKVHSFLDNYDRK